MTSIHFVGIGGIGTSALARWFLKHNRQVSGSDAIASEITRQLKKEGVKIFIGHKAKNLSPKTELVIYSAAIPADNPEIKKAKELRFPVRSYAEILGELTKRYKTIAVAGAHGKSTATCLSSLVLIKASFDPTVIIGTKLKEFKNSNFRNGESEYLVVEADEHNNSFSNYFPSAAIITNIDREHLDYYKNLTNIKKAFLGFINNIKPDGVLVLNKDDKNLFSLKNKIQKIAGKNSLKVYWYSTGVNSRIISRLSASLKIFGEHNISNALAVYTLAKALNIKEKDIFASLSSYRGAWRRMEYKGRFKVKGLRFKVKVFDDYAHHPTEVKATLAGIARKWPKSRLICVFQPHQAKRLSLLFKDFIGAFDAADALILLPIYRVQGRDKAPQNVNSEKLALTIKHRIKNLKPKTSNLKTIVYLPHPKKLKQVLENFLRSSALSPRQSAIVVMMGAGDIYKLTSKLIQ